MNRIIIIPYASINVTQRSGWKREMEEKRIGILRKKFNTQICVVCIYTYICTHVHIHKIFSLFLLKESNNKHFLKSCRISQYRDLPEIDEGRYINSLMYILYTFIQLLKLRICSLIVRIRLTVRTIFIFCM